MVEDAVFSVAVVGDSCDVESTGGTGDLHLPDGVEHLDGARSVCWDQENGDAGG